MKNITNILLAAIIAVMPLAAKGAIQTNKQFDGAWYSIDTENKTATLTSGKYAQYVNIPEKITVDDVEYTVTVIGGGAFGSEYDEIETLVIPKTVKKIEAGSYNNTFNKYMTTLYLLTPDAEIASNAFYRRTYENLTINTVPGHKYTTEMLYNSYANADPIIKVGTYTFDDDGTIHMTEETDVKDDVEFTDDKNFNNNAEYRTTKATYTRKSVTAGNWCSLCLPFDCEIPEGVSVYEFIEMKSDAVVFSEVEKITAGVPYVFKSAAGGDVTFSAENALIKTRADLEKVSKVTNGKYVFCGTLNGHSFKDKDGWTTWSMTKTYYGIEKQSNTFKKLKNGYGVTNQETNSECSPYHAFIEVKENGNSAPALKVIGGGDDGTTGIGGMKTEEVKTDAIYNLNGQRMAAPRKGINIINGKKVIIK